MTKVLDVRSRLDVQLNVGEAVLKPQDEMEVLGSHVTVS